MQQFAVGWLVVQLAIRDGRPERASLYIGLIGLAQFVPALVLGLIAGIAADRMDRRTVLLASRAGSALATAVLAMLVITGNIAIEAVIALSAISTATFVFDSPARTALIPDLVGRGTFVSAMYLIRASHHASLLVGPLLGGVLIVPIGIGGTMLVNAAMYIVSVFALLALPRVLGTRVEDTSGAFRSLGDAFKYVRRTPTILTLMLFLGAFPILAQPYQQLLPAFAHDSLGVGPVELSLLISAGGIGAVLGTLTMMRFVHVWRLGAVITIDAAIAGGLLVLLGLQRDLLPALVTLAMLGATTVVFMNTTSTLVHSHLPDPMRGRGQAIMVTMVQAGTPLGTLLLGALGAAVGVSNALIAAGAGLIVLTLLIFFRAPTHGIELGDRFR